MVLGTDFTQARPHRRTRGRAKLPLERGLAGAKEGRPVVPQSDESHGRRRRGAEAAGGKGEDALTDGVSHFYAQGLPCGQTQPVQRGIGQQTQVHL